MRAMPAADARRPNRCAATACCGLTVVVLGALGPAPAHADPLAIDQTSGQIESDAAARDDAVDRLLGAPIDDPLVVALDGAVTPLAGWSKGAFYLIEPKLHLSVGDGVPENNGGEEEPGGFTPQLSTAGLLVWGPVEVRATPWIRTGFLTTDGAAVDGLIDVKNIWAGVHVGGLTVGFGREDRWFGPSRHGSLTLTDNAVPPWMGTVSGEGRLPWVFRYLGRLRGELQVGWLGEPRGDWNNVGLMVGDARWLPIPELELGVTRMTLFGGEGRPPANIGQLIIPTEPHIYNDPNLLLPDQDELVALDFRINLPVQKWLPDVPIRHAEGYWQYGGEDVIARKAFGIPYPSLAGVANIYGGEVAVGPVTVNGEFSRLMDDTFRWYVGHRVYHEGFTQDGRPLGNYGGTDSETLWGRLGWEGEGPKDAAWLAPRVALWADHQRRVGVIEARNGKTFDLGTEEHRWRVGAEASAALPIAVGRGQRLSGGYTLEHVTGEDFVPNADRFLHRAWVSWSVDFSGRAKAPSLPAPNPDYGPQERERYDDGT